MHFVIEFRGSEKYLVDDRFDWAGTLAQAMRFESAASAEAYMAKRDWILFNGGCVIDARTIRLA